jgi:hypothetical protein
MMFDVNGMVHGRATFVAYPWMVLYVNCAVPAVYFYIGLAHA